MKIERTKNTIRNMSWGYIYRVTSMILPFCFRTVMIKALGADYLGISSLFTSILQMLSLSELGFGSAIVFSMYKPIAENNIVKICALLNFYKKVYIAIGSIIFAVGIIIMPFIPHLIAGEYPIDINIFFVYFIFLLNTSISYFLFSYRGSLINAFQRNDIESKILIIISLFRYGLEIVGIWVTKQYYWFLLIELVSTVLQNFVKFKVTKKMFPQLVPLGDIDAEERKYINYNVMALMCHKIGGIILNSADNIVLSAFMGVVIVSNYGNYYYVMNAVENMIIICFSGMTAGIGNSFVVDTVDKSRDHFKRVLFFNGWMVCFCCVCLLCLYQDFMQLWVGKEYMFDMNIVILFVLYFFVHSMRRTIIVFRDGAGLWQDNKWQPIVSAMFNIVMNIALVQRIGVAGILISSIVSMVLIDIPWETFTFCKKIEMKSSLYLSSISRYFVITILASAIVLKISCLIHVNLVFGLILKGFLCIIITNIVLLIVLRNQDEYSYFKRLAQELLRRLLDVISR